MSEKAYAGDVIQITKPDEAADYKAGAIFVVDFRQSELGACDDDILTTTTEEIVCDSEYIIIEKINTIHAINELKNKFLSRTNDRLLSDFKWGGNSGVEEFHRFMDLIRKMMADK